MKKHIVVKPNLLGLFSNLLGFELGGMPYFTRLFSSDIEEIAKRAAAIIHDDPENSVYHVADIRNLTFIEIQKQLAKIGIELKVGDTDLLVGGPVCFGFTLLNAEQRSIFHHYNFLMLEMLRLVGEIKPKVVLIEQVPALLTKQMRPFLHLFITVIERLGIYEWDYQVLNAANFGCFQSRNRVIFMLVRKDLGIKPSFPTQMPVDLTKQSAYAAIGAELIMNTQFRNQNGGKERIIDGKKNLFPTLTSGKIRIFKNGFWQDLSLSDRKILAHMEQYPLEDAIPVSRLTKMLGMMVLPPFSNALCKHVYENILLKAA